MPFNLTWKDGDILKNDLGEKAVVITTDYYEDGSNFVGVKLTTTSCRMISSQASHMSFGWKKDHLATLVKGAKGIPDWIWQRHWDIREGWTHYFATAVVRWFWLMTHTNQDAELYGWLFWKMLSRKVVK